jgi:Tfp pilus assembly protein PilF
MSTMLRYRPSASGRTGCPHKEDRPLSEPSRPASWRKLAPLCLVLAMTACAGTGQSPPAATAASAPAPSLALDSGRAALAAGDYARAELALGEALRRDPGQAEAQLGMAEVALGRGQPSQAEQAFARLVATAQTPSLRARALEGRGLALLQLQRLPEAREALLAATAAEPNLSRAWDGLGQIHDRAQDFDAAHAAYDRALVLRPNWPSALNNLGVSLLRSGNAKGAEQRFAQALALQPSLQAADMNLRLARAAQGRYAEAVAGITGKRRADVLNNIGYVAMLRGDEAEARRLLQEALSASPSLHRPAKANLEFLNGLQHGTSVAAAH